MNKNLIFVLVNFITATSSFFNNMCLRSPKSLETLSKQAAVQAGAPQAEIERVTFVPRAGALIDQAKENFLNDRHGSTQQDVQNVKLLNLILTIWENEPIQENRDILRETIYDFSVRDYLGKGGQPQIGIDGITFQQKYISSLEGLANFPNIENVRSMSFWWNKLTELGPDSFRGCNNLRFLNLSMNRLRNIDQYAFRGLVNLVTLDLSNNKLIRLPKGMFANLPALKRIILSGNYFSGEEIRRIRQEAGANIQVEV